MADTLTHPHYFSPLMALGTMVAAIALVGTVYLCKLEAQTASQQLINASRVLGVDTNVSETTQAMRD